jgi:hypothetical protein
MSMKKTDLAKNLALKISGQMKGAGVPGRFAQGAADVVDRREQRKRDAAAGLVPFACKLPAELVKLLNERAAGHEGGVNALVAQLLGKGLQ